MCRWSSAPPEQKRCSVGRGPGLEQGRLRFCRLTHPRCESSEVESGAIGEVEELAAVPLMAARVLRPAPAARRVFNESY